MSGRAGISHDGECCSCVPRLRDQNKKSSDEWTKRTAEMQSDLVGLRHLMVEASRLGREGAFQTFAMSTYARAALAAAIKDADDARIELVAVKAEMLRQRRERLYLESRLQEMQRLLAKANLSGRDQSGREATAESVPLGPDSSTLERNP